MIREAIAALVDGQDLTDEQATACMEEIMSGEVTPAQLGAFLVALRMKGETVDEIVAFALVMRAKALSVKVAGPLLDTCGTGGDGSGSFNVSTAAAFVAAGTGVRVAKHGNRSMTSQCGSADVLEALGAKIDLPPEGVAACIERAGIGFMFAQTYHPAMKHAAGPRREIGVRTVFNILGPITNPANAESRVLGVADSSIAEKLAEALGRLGTKHALVVHGEDGLDEVSVSATTQIHEVTNGKVTTATIHPNELEIPTHLREAVRGGSPKENARMLRNVLKGEAGALRDFTLMNAAAALVAADRSPDFLDGFALASGSIDSGAALEKLDAFIRVSNEVATST